MGLLVKVRTSVKVSSKSDLGFSKELAIKDNNSNDLGGLRKHPKAGEKVLALDPTSCWIGRSTQRCVVISNEKQQEESCFYKMLSSQKYFSYMGVIVAK